MLVFASGTLPDGVSARVTRCLDGGFFDFVSQRFGSVRLELSAAFGTFVERIAFLLTSWVCDYLYQRGMCAGLVTGKQCG